MAPPGRPPDRGADQAPRADAAHPDHLHHRAGARDGVRLQGLRTGSRRLSAEAHRAGRSCAPRCGSSATHLRPGRADPKAGPRQRSEGRLPRRRRARAADAARGGEGPDPTRAPPAREAPGRSGQPWEALAPHLAPDRPARAARHRPARREPARVGTAGAPAVGVSNLAALVEDVRGPACMPLAKEHPIRVHAPEHLAMVAESRPASSRLLANLLSNAVRYSPQGLVPSTSRSSRPASGCTSPVADRCLGVPKEHHRIIFERLRTRARAVLRGARPRPHHRQVESSSSTAGRSGSNPIGTVGEGSTFHVPAAAPVSPAPPSRGPGRHGPSARPPLPRRGGCRSSGWMPAIWSPTSNRAGKPSGGARRFRPLGRCRSDRAPVRGKISVVSQELSRRSSSVWNVNPPQGPLFVARVEPQAGRADPV